MIIYKTTNLINGKIYVGSDKNNNEKYLGSGKLLKQSIKKYGKQSFKKEVLQKCSSLNELKYSESYWIKKLKSNIRGIGYNISDGYYGGDCFSNHPNKEEYRQKLKNAIIGEKNRMFGKSVYDVWKEKYSKKDYEEKVLEYKKKLSEGVRKSLKNRKVKGAYENWLEKFGKEKADENQKKLNEKRKNNAKGSNNSNSKIVEIYENDLLIARYNSYLEFQEKENKSYNFVYKNANKIIHCKDKRFNGKFMKVIKKSKNKNITGGVCEVSL
jgi:hypothetical protein